MYCVDCKWFDNTVQRPGMSNSENTGRCRVHAPIAAKTGEEAWPFCVTTDWCGHFVAKAS